MVYADHLNFPSAERFGHLFDVLNNGSNAADRVKHAENNHNDQEWYENNVYFHYAINLFEIIS